MTYELHLGDCLEVLRGMPADSIDSIVTDPPYGLRFMGKKWDYDVPSVEIWSECLRVLKPGGHLLAFAGTRTQHRMAVRIEDAGFEIRDMIAWVYGSGFPKSHNLSSEHQGWGTALKPALEPITMARKPLIGTVAANVAAFGTGALHIDPCRVSPTGERLGGGDEAGKISKPEGWARPWMHDPEHVLKHADKSRANVEKATALGRWPANLMHDGSDEVLAAFPDAPGQLANTSLSAESIKNQNVYGVMRRGNEASANNVNGGGVGFQMRPGVRRLDAGSAARFFYCAKASRSDRNGGLASGDQPAVAKDATMRDRENADWPARNGNHHPTVKPTELMAYLLRLVTPVHGVALDPFMGSGSTGKAAMREGFRFIGCELDHAYLAIAESRIQHELSRLAQLAAQPVDTQLDMFSA